VKYFPFFTFPNQKFTKASTYVFGLDSKTYFSHYFIIFFLLIYSMLSKWNFVAPSNISKIIIIYYKYTIIVIIMHFFMSNIQLFITTNNYTNIDITIKSNYIIYNTFINIQLYVINRVWSMNVLMNTGSIIKLKGRIKTLKWVFSILNN
jgi:hypothetical protein